MPRFRPTLMMSLALATIASWGPVTAAAAECKLVGAIGNGLTEGIAQFMAEKALQNVMDAKGLKPSGDVKYTCEAAMLGSECKARQQGCK